MTFEEVRVLGLMYHHKFIVMKYLGEIIRDLVSRAEQHDNSKFDEDEFPIHVEAYDVFVQNPYGTPEYEALREKYKNLFAVHWKKYRHHPEFYSNGIEDMTLVDLIEMLADWKAASLRNPNGSIETSIKVGGEKYNLSPQLVKILENTAKACKM